MLHGRKFTQQFLSAKARGCDETHSEVRPHTKVVYRSYKINYCKCTSLCKF